MNVDVTEGGDGDKVSSLGMIAVYMMVWNKRS